MRISEKPSRDGRPSPGRGSEADGEWAGLSAPVSRRLPVPRRERKPALAALAVLLVLGGALATTLLVMRTGDRVSAILITKRLGAGQRIDTTAMREVRIARTGVDYVPWQVREQVSHAFAGVTIVPGTLLTRAMTSRASQGLEPGKAIVGLALKAGQAPAGLREGDHVQVIYVPAREGATSRVLVDRAVVHTGTSGADADGAGAGGNGAPGQVTVIVDASVSPTVAQYASSGEIALAELPEAS